MLGVRMSENTALPPVLCTHYRPIALLGQGGMSTIYAAVDTRVANAPVVAIKMLTLGAPAADWKTRELFERSTRVLQDLSHPALPKVHAFEQDDTGRFFLVREAFDGGTLQERIARDQRHVDEASLRRLLVRLLELLDYLHQRLPPVIHRDIKPANIMFRTEGDWDPVLVDFDTVMAPAENRSGMTIIGTPGYAAPEQFVGDASPSSDLYGLGATMLFVLTHVDADRLPRKDGRFDVEDRLASLHPTLASALRTLVEPEKSKRFASAADALQAIHAIDAPHVRLAPMPMYAPTPGAPLPGTARPGPIKFIAVVGGGLVASIVLGMLLLRGSAPAPIATKCAPGDPLCSEQQMPRPTTAATPTATATATATTTPSAIAPPAPPDWSHGACNGITDCYKKSEAWGDMSGKLTAVMGSDGRAKTASYDGTAPWPVRKCLVDLGKTRVLNGYQGPGGKLACTYRGTILDGTVQLMQSFTFKEDAAKNAGK